MLIRYSRRILCILSLEYICELCAEWERGMQLVLRSVGICRWVEEEEHTRRLWKVNEKWEPGGLVSPKQWIFSFMIHCGCHTGPVKYIVKGWDSFGSYVVGVTIPWAVSAEWWIWGCSSLSYKCGLKWRHRI